MTGPRSMNHYFIGANTSIGFIPCADDVFSSANRLYIIKGAPGTGKSRLMTDIANEAENRRMTVDYFHCSSDADSLDGIYLRESKVGVLDGTSPHARDPIFPGAVEEILWLGDFWDCDRLIAKSDSIRQDNSEKQRLFRSVYRLMAANDTLTDEKNALLESCFNAEKCKQAVSRLIRTVPNGREFTLLDRQIEAVGMTGHIILDTYRQNAGSVIAVNNTHGIGTLVMKTIREELEAKKQFVYGTRSPLSGMTYSGFHLPDQKLSILMTDTPDETDRMLRTDRFLIHDKFREIRQKYRAVISMQADLQEEIFRIFSQIKETHFRLESTYQSAMNFKKKEEYTKKTLVRIFA